LRGLALNSASTHQAENPRGFSEVGENKQLPIAIVSNCYSTSSTSLKISHTDSHFPFGCFLLNIIHLYVPLAPSESLVSKPEPLITA